ncbi:NACHT domain-containing protein [Burkholderia sp. MR1-5-21]
MALLRSDIERALDELASQEEGMRFQGLAVVLGKKRWPELIARERKKDLGLDAYAPATQAPGSISKGLAASITPTLKKISDDAETAKKNFPDLKALLFVTSAKVGNAVRKRWEEAIQDDHGLELHIIEREEIITLMMMPENISLCTSFLHVHTDVAPQLADLVERTRRAANAVTQAWAGKTKGHPLIDLAAVRLDLNGAESADVLSVEQIDAALSRSGRVVLEGPAGRGKTTTLIQLAQRSGTAGTAFIVELPAWTSSRRGILEYIAGMPAFQAEGLTAADLARVQQTEPFVFLLNGWNEITESNSVHADEALRELERDFPSAGIIVATRTHHLTPPLPGALRLRLLRLRRVQRTAYLASRLGGKSAELRARIDADRSLDAMTRTPFILSEVTTLFEAGAEIPSTKIGVLDQVLRLQDRRDEHRNALQSAPIFGRQSNYLQALGIEMTRRGAVALPEAVARAIISAVARQLADSGQIDAAGAPAVLATLTAHHVLERVDYPQTAFQFEHQQLQEYYAAFDVRTRLLELLDDDHDATARFTADYVNDPAWAEPLRMIAETFAEQTGDGGTDRQNTLAGRKLVEMALDIDLVFAGEQAQLCGAAVWDGVRVSVGERLRAIYTGGDDNFRQCAIAAMLATGANDFSDIIVPLLSAQDQQTRFRTFRLWPDFQVSSLGPNWREQVRGWTEEARVDFVSELLHHRADDDIAAFAVEDDSIAVKKAAASGLMWTGSDEVLIRVLESMDTQTFEEVARENFDRMPAVLRPKSIAAMRKFMESTMDLPARLRIALDLIELGETGLDGVVKDTMASLPGGDMRNLGSHYIQPALEHLRKTDPAWTSEWVAIQIAEVTLYGHEYWLPFATAIPDDVVEKYLNHLETENLKNGRFHGMAAVVAAGANAELAARVFAKLRELRHKVDMEPGQPHEFEWQVIRQLETVFHDFSDDVAAAGVLLSVTSGVPLDIKVAADLLTKIARSDAEPLHIADDDLKARLRAYLKGSVDLVLHQDDFNGQEKANLALAIAQVGQPEDMAELMTLIRADIERVRRGRAARAAGDRGPIGNGGSMCYAHWHVNAAMHLDPAGAEQALIDLLHEPEYVRAIATAMARDILPKPEFAFERALRYDSIWDARAGRVPPFANDQRRRRFAAALNAEITRLQEQNLDSRNSTDLTELTKALAAIDGRHSATAVLDVIGMPGHWDQYACVDAAERLLMAGVVLPAITVFTLIDSFLKRTGEWMHESDRYLLRRILALCPFTDDPAAGIAKIREMLGKGRLWAPELADLVTALGESRTDAAVDLLYELASDAPTFEQCEGSFINAFAALDTPRARELLLGLVDPEIQGITLPRSPYRDDVLVARLTELARKQPEMAARLRNLCERDLPELNRHFISQVMHSLGTPEALAANLNLIDDTKPSPVPQGIWGQLKTAFVEQRPYEQDSNVFTQHAHASNELRIQLFRMSNEDEKRRKSAFMLLAKIEEWRLEYGRPTGEPRHPDIASGRSWPPREP